MAMLHKRDKPTYYKIVDSDGKVHGVAAKSKVVKLLRLLAKQAGRPLFIKLKEEK